MYGRDRIQQEEDDERYARQLYEEEMRAARGGSQPSIKDLQEALDLSLAKLIYTQENTRADERDIEILRREYNLAEEKLKAAQARQRVENPAPARPPMINLPSLPTLGNQSPPSNVFGSYQQMHNWLEPPAAARPQEPQVKRAEPLRTFSPEELAKIRAHYNDRSKVSEHLHSLIDAALNDEEISLDLINNPVFIRGEVRIYDKAVVKSLLKANGEGTCPTNLEKTFRESDLIPCNSLIKAMTQLLNIIDNKNSAAPINHTDILFANATNNSRKNLSADIINMVENYYDKQLLDRQKALFDIICRDPMTGVIMDDPVYLPDGYVYDRSTILFCQRLAGPNKSVYNCPGNEALKFTNEDVTACYFVKSVLEQLKANVFAMQAMMQRAAIQQVAEAQQPIPLQPTM